MIKFMTVATFATGIALSGAAWAGGNMECPTGKKVTALLESWETVSTQASAGAPADQEKVAALASQCPVGSRMKETLGAVKDALGFVVASQESHAKDCPVEKLDPSDPSCAAAKEMKAFRTQALSGLSQLASYASNASCSAAASCSVAASDSKECNASSQCPIRIASRLGELKGSFDLAKQEVAALSPSDRGAILASFASMAESHQAVSLMPESVMTLAEGLDGLHQMHGKMAEWAQSNPEIMKSVPEATRLAFQAEVAVIDEARQVLQQVTETMKAMQAPIDASEMVGAR